MRLTIYFFIFSILLITLFSCGRKEGSINIACTNVETFQCNEGIINIGQREIGDLIVLDTLTKTAYSLGRLHFSLNDLDSSTKRDSMTVLTFATFQFQFSGEIAQVPADIKSSIESEIQNNTTFYLANSIRKSLHNPLHLINNTKLEDLTSYKAYLHEKNTIIALITSITYADKFKFRVQNSTDNQMDVDTKVGRFRLQINYNCQNSLEINAKQDGIFYKVTYFKLDSSDTITFSTFHTDLTKFKMVQNIM